MNPAPVGVLIKNAPVEGSTWYTIGDWHQLPTLEQILGPVNPREYLFAGEYLRPYPTVHHQGDT